MRATWKWRRLGAVGLLGCLAVVVLGTFVACRKQGGDVAKETTPAASATDAAAAGHSESARDQLPAQGEAKAGSSSGSSVPSPDAAPVVGFEIGNIAPDIEGQDTDGVSFKLSDYRGKVVVLDFWGHW